MSRRPLLLCSFLAAAACNQTSNIGSRWVRSQNVIAAQGATIEVTAADASSLAGASLRLLPGDLPADTTVTLDLATPLGGEPRPAGPAAVWGPEGLTLLRPAVMTLPLQIHPRQSVEDLLVLYRDPAGRIFKVEHAGLSVDASASRVSFRVMRLGLYQPAAVMRCSLDIECGGDEKCGSGECHGPPPGSCHSQGCPCIEDIDCAAGLVCKEKVCGFEHDGGP